MAIARFLINALLKVFVKLDIIVDDRHRRPYQRDRIEKDEK